MNKIRANSKSNVKSFAMTAMFAALITVTTMFIKIPTPFGYAHAGDSMVYLGATILPGPFGIIAASLGGALADLLSGYAHWAIPTAIIKALNAVPFVMCSIALKKHSKDNKIINIPNLAMLIPAAIVTIGGYFVANFIIYGLGAAIGETPSQCLQAVTASIIYVSLGAGLDTIKFKQKIR